MYSKRKSNKRQAGTFIGAWVPELTTVGVNRAVRAFGFRNRSRFLRAVLNAAVEELTAENAKSAERADR